MAGGGGTRFWPLSRKAVPKQFLNLTGNDIMVNETYDRLKGLVEPEDIFIVTNKMHAKMTKELMQGRVSDRQILAEPAARNTAACIGYAAIEILHKYGDGVMCILASDHFIRDKETYSKTLERAIQLAEETDSLITIGIKPTFPSTGYGYIKNHKESGQDYHVVEEFVEKPDKETATSYLKEGTYAWNSGQFVWKASVILKYFERLLPDIYACLMKIADSFGTEEEREVIEEVYPDIPKISIDYGIMERADKVLMLEGDFGWDDVGSFDTLASLGTPDEQGNVCVGDALVLKGQGNICYGTGEKLIATLGVDNMIVVETKDAVLVCSREMAQEVKIIPEELERLEKRNYL